MPTGHPLTPADHAQMLALHRQGAPVKAIAAAMGCSPQAVYKLLADARISAGRVRQLRALVNNLQAGGDGMVPPPVRLPMQTVVHRYLADESLKSLARSYRVSQRTIRRLLERAGVTIRPRRHRVPVGLRRWTPQEGARALRLRAQGHDMATIGLMLNRSTKAVSLWLQRHRQDVPTFPGGGNPA
jgi:transposase-like protein